MPEEEEVDGDQRGNAHQPASREVMTMKERNAQFAVILCESMVSALSQRNKKENRQHSEKIFPFCENLVGASFNDTHQPP